LRYNVAQYGSPIPILWGTNRVSLNVLDGYNFQSHGSGAGKGGVSGAKGKSGGKTYTVNTALGFCVGPVNIHPNNSLWVNAGISNTNKVPLNFYNGSDGQLPDPVFASSSPNTPVIGYSGLFYATGTPMQLGNSPVLPNLSAEINGFRTGTAGPETSVAPDASPRWILFDMLYDPRIGIGFPGRQEQFNLWGTYCQAALLGFSLLCDKQQPLSSWVEELMQLTVSAFFWSSGRIRVVPYSIVQQDFNGAVYFPNLTPAYYLTDDDFLPWSTGTHRSAGEKDPVQIMRLDASQLANWLTIEIMLRSYWYEPFVQPPTFDQAAVELYGVRTESAVQAHEICTTNVGSQVVNAMLLRKYRLRNTFKFRVGWRYMLLEPMDVVAITDTVSGLYQYPVRVSEVEEDDLGALTITAEELV
jgi:hypothetical protein